MRQVAAGEIGGLESLYDRYHGMAYALALRITTETGLAEDVVQDSFLGVWRNAGRYAEA
jgi:DNA-directed RNA polymerase specialized sigma24 family protein